MPMVNTTGTFKTGRIEGEPLIKALCAITKLNFG